MHGHQRELLVAQRWRHLCYAAGLLLQASEAAVLKLLACPWHFELQLHQSMTQGMHRRVGILTMHCLIGITTISTVTQHSKGPVGSAVTAVHRPGGRLFDPNYASNHTSPHLHTPCAPVLGHVAVLPPLLHMYWGMSLQGPWSKDGMIVVRRVQSPSARLQAKFAPLPVDMHCRRHSGTGIGFDQCLGSSIPCHQFTSAHSCSSQRNCHWQRWCSRMVQQLAAGLIAVCGHA